MVNKKRSPPKPETLPARGTGGRAGAAAASYRNEMLQKMEARKKQRNAKK